MRQSLLPSSSHEHSWKFDLASIALVRLKPIAANLVQLIFTLFISPNLKLLIESDKHVSSRLLNENPLRVRNAFLLAKDAIVIPLPHIHVHWPSIIIDTLFLRFDDFIWSPIFTICTFSLRILPILFILCLA
jgi:hypothetical protein